MAPKQKITRDQIIDGAVNFVRENGADALKARELSLYLHCSTQPIFSNFSGMTELRQTVIRQAIRICDGYVGIDCSDPDASLKMGIGYLRFANEERNLFRLLFLNSKDDMQSVGFDCDKHKTDGVFRKILGEGEKKSERLRLEKWVAVHGIAALICTGYFDWDMENTKKMLTNIFCALSDRFAKNGES